MADPRRTALVTGASGVIGPSLVQALVHEGARVKVLLRRGDMSSTLPAAAEVVVGDLGDHGALDRAVAGVDQVFHLAAKLHIDTTDADEAARAEYERVNATATHDLVRLCETHGVRRFVYFSTIGVYGSSRPGEVFDERSPVHGGSLYTATKLRGEEAALLAPSPVVLRLAAVYGPRMKGNYRTLARAIQSGLFLRVGNGTNRRTLVHEQDVVAAALLAAEHAAPRSVYNVTDGQIHTVRDILTAIASAAGTSLLPGHIPVGPLRFAAGAAESFFHLLGKRSPLRRAMVDKLLEDVAVSGQRLQSELGFVPVFDLATGWRHALSPADTHAAQESANCAPC